LLADAPLTLAAVEERLRTGNLQAREQLDWLLRAFWVSPSLRRFSDAGERIEEALLTSEQRYAESTSRPRHAEFDAMKQRLRDGVRAEGRADVPVLMEEQDHLVDKARSRAPLPAVRPSFLSEGDIAFTHPMRPFTLEAEEESGVALIDALSAFHGVGFRARSFGPTGSAHIGILGLWDVGSIGVAFDAPVRLNGTTARGARTALGITSIELPLGNQLCTGTAMSVRGRDAYTSWRNAIVVWVGKDPLPAPAAVAVEEFSGKTRFEKLTVQQIDLDRDGVPDFRIYAGVEPPQASTETYWKAVFANLNGAWRLVGFSQERDCT
jgi:hypothetical protein